MQLTGNPFVDTGLGVLAALGGCKQIEQLDIDTIKRVHGNGEKLARRNSMLKSMSMIFTINSLSTNPGIKDKDKRLLYYSKITTALLDSIGKEEIDERCESCGFDKSLDLDKLIRNTLVPLGYEDDTRYIGRDWFPLAGSLKSDAQALPASSRGPNICATCLFSVHYLTHGVILIGGRLSVFQSTNISFWFGFIKNLVKEIDNRISVGEYNTLGAKDTTTAIKRLLLFLKDLKYEEINATLYLWKFSNSGTGADCSIEEIPNDALVFLHQIEREGLENEVFDYLKKEKGGQNSLFNCILYHKDYPSLYPYKKFNGSSLRLFYLYQTIVRKFDESVLLISYKIAKYAQKKLSFKQLEHLGKDLERDVDKKNQIKKLIAEMVSENLISIDDYESILNCSHDTQYHHNPVDQADSDGNNYSGKDLLSVSYDSWKFIKYYLHKVGEDDLDFRGGEKIDISDVHSVIEKDNSNVRDNYIENFMSKVKYIGFVLLDNYIQEHGKDKFFSSILKDYSRSVDVSWLRRQFVKASIRNNFFTFQTWMDLCVSREGKEEPYELLYYFRLLWLHWSMQKDKDNELLGYKKHLNFSDLNRQSLENVNSNIVINKSNSISGNLYSFGYVLNKSYADSLKSIVEEYIVNKGKSYFIRYILDEIKRGNITLNWYKKRLKLSEDEWDSFLNSESQRNLSSIRLFQLNLLTVEFSREYLFKELCETRIT